MEPPRKRGRPFVVGNQLGRGRPAGSRNKATLVLQELLEGEAENITRKAIELAKKGDITAIRLCLERLIPPYRERRLNLNLPEMATAEDIHHAIRAVYVELAEGNLTITEAERVAGLLDFGRRAIETRDLERRLAEIEKQMQQYHERRAA